ncbi:putative pectinesterase/pectinesterase inhibitor 17 [Sesamum angolense]|uniref:Pectinesterase n=1 Tax=Sesamum angolense TaxID=2727404 RepID=A0AAE1W1M5_9LAMI|nr:putative pectinesterase/pectinesterase inhibitor 17 [Sesamum angolense]
MSMDFKFFAFFFISFSSFLLPAVSNPPSVDINWWCNQTPYPEPCKHFMSRDPRRFVPKHKSDFRKMAVQLALERAIRAGDNTKSLGHKCRNEREKAAWADCVKLYENTIEQLNKTIDPNTKCSDFDAQTWLSTALTNLETCRTGFAELGVSDFVLPLMSNNVSKLICNTLALGSNETTHETSAYYKDGGFPTWVSSGDRRLLQSSSARPNLVVAQDGSGNYRRRLLLTWLRGGAAAAAEVLEEVPPPSIPPPLVSPSALLHHRGDWRGFIARGVTFRNTAGPQNHQAVALRSGSDLSVFYRCGFEGYHTLTSTQRQFYKECYVYGTVDFIFGNAAVVLQNCMIYARRPMDQQKNTITAQGRTDPNQNTGISIHDSRVMAAADLVPVLGSFRTFLGRPWKEYSRTVFMQTYLDSLVDPAGWLEWDGNFALNTLYYGEYRNMGPSSSTSRRVRWRGYRVITSAAEAGRFTVANFIAGQSWLPATGVPFTAGL